MNGKQEIFMLFMVDVGVSESVCCNTKVNVERPLTGTLIFCCKVIKGTRKKIKSLLLLFALQTFYNFITHPLLSMEKLRIAKLVELSSGNIIQRNPWQG